MVCIYFDTPADTDKWVSRFMKTAAAFPTTKYYNVIDVNQFLFTCIFSLWTPSSISSLSKKLVNRQLHTGNKHVFD